MIDKPSIDISDGVINKPVRFSGLCLAPQTESVFVLIDSLSNLAGRLVKCGSIPALDK